MRSDVLEIVEAINLLQNELKDIQNKCRHHNIKYKYGSNTNNWCDVDDTYWVDIECKDCGKRFTFFNSEPEYRLNDEIGSVSKEKDVATN